VDLQAATQAPNMVPSALTEQQAPCASQQSGTVLLQDRFQELPHDVVHIIFSKLEFLDKIAAGLVCKRWDQLLKAGSTSGRHWFVMYDVNAIVRRAALRATVQDSADMSSYNIIERCVPAYSHMRVHHSLCMSK
jgi:hypothetical protein